MKKKFIIIGTVSVVIIATIVVAVLLLTGKESKITISFDVDGGKSVSSIEIKKGESIKLPDANKEGYTFDGWFLNDQRVTDSTAYDKDVTLKAKWISNGTKTFTVTFDSDGGSKVESIKVECDKEISLPTNPTKEGYTFISWIDKNETPIYDKALLSCEDITLKANWKKEETGKEETKQKTYKCPSGYTLNGTKCTATANATEECPPGYNWSIKVNKCVVQTTANEEECPSGSSWSDKKNTCISTTKDREKTCVIDSYAGVGAIYDDGYCYHGSDPAGSGNPEMCEIRGGVYYNGFCFIKRTTPISSCPNGYTSATATELGSNFGAPKAEVCYKIIGAKIKTCPSGYKLYHSDPNFGAGDRCVKLTNKEKKCPSGYTLNGDNCVKTIDATYE